MTMDFFLKAMELARLGFHVFPMSDNLHGVPHAELRKQATDDSAMLSVWSRHYPGAAVGVEVGERSWLLLLSVADPTGFKTVRQLHANGRDFGRAPLSTSFGNGMCVWFRHVSGVLDTVLNDGREILPGVSVLTTGDWVRAPEGVRKANALGTTWLEPPWMTPPPTPPIWLLKLIAEHAEVAAGRVVEAAK